METTLILGIINIAQTILMALALIYIIITIIRERKRNKDENITEEKIDELLRKN